MLFIQIVEEWERNWHTDFYIIELVYDPLKLVMIAKAFLELKLMLLNLYLDERALLVLLGGLSGNFRNSTG